jgi:L-alanine-DL-glutamate epimerase-like enolase superfamily enzyme
MIITKVRACPIEAAFPRPFAYLRKWHDKNTTVIVEIETDRGLVGRGGCQGVARAVLQAVASLTPWLVGENPLQPTQVRQAIYARLGDLDLAEAGSALSGVYAALWEIKDKQILLSTTPAAWAGRIAREARSLPGHPFEAPANAIHAPAPWPQDSAA